VVIVLLEVEAVEPDTCDKPEMSWILSKLTVKVPEMIELE